MELRQLTYFLTAAQTQNFRKAAEICLVAQPALSRQIAALEDELGVELFKREKQHVSLTQAGWEFAQYVRAAFDDLQEGQQAMAKIQTGQQGMLHIGCVEPLAAAFLPAIYEQFHQLYPAIQLRIRVTQTDEMIKFIEQEVLDLGFIFDPTTQSETVRVKELFRQPLYLLTSPHHDLAQVSSEEITLQRISEERLLLLPPRSRVRRNIERICTQRAISLHPLIEIDSIEGLKELVKRGTGISLLPPALVRTEQIGADLCLRPIVDVPDSFSFALIYRRTGTLSLPARQLINLVLKAVEPTDVTTT